MERVAKSSVDSISSLIKEAAASFGESIFVRPYESDFAPVTYDDLDAFVNGLQKWFDDRAVGCEAVVAVVSANSTLMALLTVGVMASGRCLVPMHPSSGQREIAHIFEIVRPALVIHVGSRAIAEVGAVMGIAVLEIKSEAEFITQMLRTGRDGTQCAVCGVKPETIAEIVFTSGSAGRAKGVQLTHRSLLSNSDALVRRYKLRAADRCMTAVPLFHVGGQSFTTLGPIWVGASTTVVPTDMAMSLFWELASLHGITWSTVMTAFLNILLMSQEAPSATKLVGLLVGGEKTSARLMSEFEARFRVRLYQVYGLTEIAAIAVCESPGDATRKLGSAGKPLDTCKVQVIGKDGLPVPPGEVGEVWLAGESLFSGYARMPDETKKVLVDGASLRTGDLGSLDEHGNLSILDRNDNLILVGGENVYPTEIEAVAKELDFIEEAIVVPVPHVVLGEELVAVYKLRNGRTFDSARFFERLRTQLAPFKIPRLQENIEKIGLGDWPRGPSGKISRCAVEELARGLLEARTNNVQREG